MKVILSRKGFDSAWGQMPSPILPDNILLSMPIPKPNDKTEYKELNYNGISYDTLLHSLKKDFKYTNCHLDPDLRETIKKRDKWVPAFGQSGAPLTHLMNHGVKEGDIFLFFGWFRKTYDCNGEIKFLNNAPNIHVLFGYMQIGRILQKREEFDEVYWHPHANIENYKDVKNAIFIPSDSFLGTKHPGYGLFKFDKNLVLTKDGYSRSCWNLPECLKGKNITYHSDKNIKEDYFQSAKIGQEFIIDADEDIIDWIKSLLQYKE